jgi:DNA adenine methylase
LTPPRPAGPVLKWAGGKRQLIPQLRQFVPATVGRYWEPFLGSGALFFDLCTSGRLDPAGAHLSDDNADLIGTYLRVRDATEPLLGALERLAERHAQDARAHYYRVRDEEFNPLRRAWMASGGHATSYPVELAAMLLYLNRTGYNGLFRLNAAGDFNVPAGRYDAPRIVHAERIRAAAALLARAEIRCLPFDAALVDARRGDVVYLDPPYAPLSKTANFRSYTAAGFDAHDQERLHDLVVRLASQGVQVIVSNSTAPQIVKLYDDRAARRAGLRCFRVPARRSINTRADRRGVVDELVVTNVRRARTPAAHLKRPAAR